MLPKGQREMLGRDVHAVAAAEFALCSAIPHADDGPMELNLATQSACALMLSCLLLICLLQSMEAAVELDPEYKMALARTRQATAIHRAIGFLNTGSRARCAGQDRVLSSNTWHAS